MGTTPEPLPDAFEAHGLLFRRVPSAPKFAVSACGVVVGLRRRPLAHRSNGKYANVSERLKSRYGYMSYTNHYVHRLVAEAWVPNPNGLPEVNHLDGDRSNNRSTNLEWCEHRDNMRHARESGLIWNIPGRGQQGFQGTKAHP